MKSDNEFLNSSSDKRDMRFQQHSLGADIRTIVPSSNPILPRKSANRLYGGYKKTGLNINNNLSPLEVVMAFCSKVRQCENMKCVYTQFHSLCINKLGYTFTAFGITSPDNSVININLIDNVGNVFTSKINYANQDNPISRCILNNSSLIVDNIDFLNIPYINNSSVLIQPLFVKNTCLGIVMAGSITRNTHSDEVLNILSDYLALHIISDKTSESDKSHNIDSLTGLKNHRSFQDSLAAEIKRAKAEKKKVSVVMVDVNDISRINREFGHSKGDEIISLVAQKIKGNIRDIDVAGRYGGDELAIILPGLDNKEAVYIAEYINYGVSCCLVDDVGSIKVSIGVATYPDCANEQEKLLLITEQAMYISKNKGYKDGNSSIISANDIDFWNEMALDSFAAVIAKRHSQWGVNFEEELVEKFHNESLNLHNHAVEVATSLAGAIDAKDPYTRGHSVSVSRYAEALARTLNLPEDEIKNISLGALLHDVGKIGVPESVLTKPGALTNEEWDIMKQHPTIGVKKVLEPNETLHSLIPIVKYHHENWDGSGYPEKLQGEEIPLAARIVAIADTFHALVSDRPYRKGLSLEKSIEILKMGAGMQWDKKLIRKFIVIAPSLYTKR